MTELNTESQYNTVITRCKELFLNKMRDYGASWRIFRLPSLTDQLYIKANRIRSVQTKKVSKVDEGIESDFIGIVNYSVIALIQIWKGVADTPDLNVEDAEKWYDAVVKKACELLECKNHDYDEAWRNMRISSITDIILVKLLRIKEIENNEGATIASEGADSNYFDILNYAVFALILIQEQTK
ncbi:MAG: DUF1599 domain-containing protein [Lentimicrobiaceae bacterium]|jgi:hypothetical protein|nr:DUF1599 domain-containing protein [Lentimicrobiaceae bacterium]